MPRPRTRTLPPFRRLLAALPVVIVFAAASVTDSASAAEPSQSVVSGPTVDLNSIIRLTYSNNLNIAIGRFDLESAELRFDRFTRTRSRFTPFIFDSSGTRRVTSELQGGSRVSEGSNSGRVTVGVDKEFFDGTNIGADVGVRANDSQSGQTATPFVEVGLRMPLIGSITRLERTIDRTFEETELYRSWLNYISSVRNTIRNSLRQYMFLQQNLARRADIEQEIVEWQRVAALPQVATFTEDLDQIRNQIQDYQSDLAGLEGQIENGRITLQDNIGFEALDIDQIVTQQFSPSNLYGLQYLNRPSGEVISEAFENDNQIQVLRIRRSNEELELELALRGKWDITGRLSGGYDFRTQGDDPRERSSYSVGVGVSVRRNDPRLLELSVQQSRADIGRLDAQIEDRRRDLTSEIRRSLNQAASTRRVIEESVVGVASRLQVYERQLRDYLEGNETVENLIQGRNQYFNARRSLTQSITQFYNVALDLDEASGQYFIQLSDLLPDFSGADGLNE
jgi:hypothetical protein